MNTRLMKAFSHILRRHVRSNSHSVSFATSCKKSNSAVGGQLSLNISKTLNDARSQGTYKHERILQSPQDTFINILNEEEGTSSRSIINLCSNNYLGFANDNRIRQAAINAINDRGFGLASGRIICGTQDLHKQLEHKLAEFHRQDDCLLYTSCFDANTGIFEALLGENDHIFSDALNHASIIDGIRLSKANVKERYKHADVDDLKQKMTLALSSLSSSPSSQSVTTPTPSRVTEVISTATSPAAVNMIVTDGIFSMDGDIAPLRDISKLKQSFPNTYLLVDECHSAGVIGGSSRASRNYGIAAGAAAYNEVPVDIINGTLGKALGGASGGYTCASQDVIDLLRQKSRPYVFSNSISPSICAASLCALDIIEKEPWLQPQLQEKTIYFRQSLQAKGFKILGADICPIIPIVIGDTQIAQQVTKELLKRGIFVMNLGYPIVPKHQARLRIQISAIHTMTQLNKALESLQIIADELKLL